VSRASLFGYRRGRLPISNKAWRKLEQLEREAGLAPPLADQIKSASPKTLGSLLSSASLPEILNLLPEENRLRVARSVLDTHIFTGEFLLQGFFSNAEALAQLVSDKKARRADMLFFARQVEKSANRCREFSKFILDALRSTLNPNSESTSLAALQRGVPEAPKRPKRKKSP
jgi:hypothetical protein